MRCRGLQIESVEVHKVLRLPRNLHFEVHKVLPSQSACACHETALPGSQSAVPATKSALKVHKVLHLPRNVHFQVHTVLHQQRFLKTSHMSKSHDSLHLSRNQSTSKITTMSKALCLPRNLHMEVKPLRSLAPVTKSRLWSTKARGFPCACHEK